MRPKVFVDGHVGTTGLRIRDWLRGRDDIALLTLPEAARKDAAARRERVLESDVSVLCLPDEAAREVAAWVRDAAGGGGNRAPRLLDASTAHRVAEGWVYGLPELAPAQRRAVAEARFVANPGCYPSAFVALVRPLVDAGLLDAGAPLAIHALSGYSGGGRALVERWEDPGQGLAGLSYEAPYALDRVHKHVPEMRAYSGLAAEPYFVPAVGPFRCGMRVQVPVHAALLAAGADGAAVHRALAARYRAEPFVRVRPLAPPGATEERTFDPESCNDTNRMELAVVPHPSGHVLLVAVLDNLGKGASGAAVQNLNLMLGRDERTGLPA